MTTNKSPRARWVWGASPSAWLVLLSILSPAACGDPASTDNTPPMATLAQQSPMGPLGLHYGERAMLQFRYRLQGDPVAGATLRLHIDRDDSGATLSADRLITNDRGDASVLLTAGASESAFHVIVTGPSGAMLSVDVAVSRFDFANMDVLVDASSFATAQQLQAGLLLDTMCAALPATPKAAAAVRSTQVSERRATLPFPTLVVKPYSVAARAEDSQGHLVAYGCVDVPEALLRTGQRALVPVPLSLVTPSPIGNYDLDLDLTAQPPATDPYVTMPCADALGQTLLDEILTALRPTNADLANRLAQLRGALDASGCRTGSGKLDDRLHTPIAATTAGTALSAIGPEAAAIRSKFHLLSTLSVYSGSNLLWQTSHTLREAHFNLGTVVATYPLDTLPVPSVHDLDAAQTGATLALPPHSLTLRFPSLWKRAVEDLSLRPRALTMTPAQLFSAAVNAAQVSALAGCSALEAVSCTGVSPPCTGLVAPACIAARDAVAARLAGAFSDAAPGYDLSLSMLLHLEDAQGTLQAQQISSGEVSGTTTGATFVLPLSGSAQGPRTGP